MSLLLFNSEIPNVLICKGLPVSDILEAACGRNTHLNSRFRIFENTNYIPKDVSSSDINGFGVSEMLLGTDETNSRKTLRREAS